MTRLKYGYHTAIDSSASAALAPSILPTTVPATFSVASSPHTLPPLHAAGKSQLLIVPGSAMISTMLRRPPVDHGISYPSITSTAVITPPRNPEIVQLIIPGAWGEVPVKSNVSLPPRLRRRSLIS